jgi:hypothetical protein
MFDLGKTPLSKKDYAGILKKKIDKAMIIIMGVFVIGIFLPLALRAIKYQDENIIKGFIFPFIIVWTYLLILWVRFYQQTHLKEYLLQKHTPWVIQVISYPVVLIDGVFQIFRKQSVQFQDPIMSIGPIIFGSIFLIVYGIRLLREREMEIETKKNLSFWKTLAKISVGDIFLLRFPTNDFQKHESKKGHSRKHFR